LTKALSKTIQPHPEVTRIRPAVDQIHIEEGDFAAQHGHL
jgi:hypothetical protein